jgi:hypothetical protein
MEAFYTCYLGHCLERGGVEATEVLDSAELVYTPESMVKTLDGGASPGAKHVVLDFLVELHNTVVQRLVSEEEQPKKGPAENNGQPSGKRQRHFLDTVHGHVRRMLNRGTEKKPPEAVEKSEKKEPTPVEKSGEQNLKG